MLAAFPLMGTRFGFGYLLHRRRVRPEPPDLLLRRYCAGVLVATGVSSGFFKYVVYQSRILCV
jgi:hypothetical protein